MEQLGTILRAVCLGVCVCGIGIGVLGAIVLGIAGGGLVSTVKDILGIGQRDEDELIDETLESIHNKRNAIQSRRAKIRGDGGIPDFDAAVARYANNDSDSNTSDRFSAQSLDEPERPDTLGGANRFGDSDRRGGIRRNKRNNRGDDYEIYDDGDFDIFGD